MDEREAVRLARRSFLDPQNVYGCAESTFIVLKAAYGLDDPEDSSAAMALNGGIAYSGGPCGAISGAALAVGILAGRRIEDHRTAKRMARLVVARLMDDFRAEHGEVDCLPLIGLDLRAPGSHEAFIASGVWRTRCMRQIEFAVKRLLPLADEPTWSATLAELEARAADAQAAEVSTEARADARAGGPSEA
jgi:C_GCAxxG_C_C family probable redox protein